MDTDDKTPPQGPFAMHLARIEGKIDQVITRQTRQDDRVMAAYALAKTAVWMRQSWGPYLVSALAFAMAFAACMRR